MKIVKSATLCAVIACGSPTGGSHGSTPGSGSVSGTLLGKPFVTADAASFGGSNGATIVLYDAAGLCGDLATNAVKANSSSLVMDVPAFAQGTYKGVSVQYAEFDATCNSPSGESGSGNVTVTSAGPNMMSGTFQMWLNSDVITGSFVAPNCAGAPGTAAQTCRP